MTRARDISRLLGRTDNEVDSEGEIIGTAGQIVDSAYILSQTPQSTGFTFYSTLDSLPSNADEGSLAFVEANTRMYLNDGNGWYSIAAVNLSPSLTLSPSGAIELATDGSPSTVTITATDTDDPSAILSYSVESDGNMLATGTTVTQDSSVFTITPITEAAGGVAGTFTLSFKVSDQIDEAVANKDFSITFSSIDNLTGGNLSRTSTSTASFKLYATGYANGTTFPYSISGFTSADLTTSLTGNMTYNSSLGYAEKTITAKYDTTLTQGSETGTFSAGNLSTNFSVTPPYHFKNHYIQLRANYYHPSIGVDATTNQDGFIMYDLDGNANNIKNMFNLGGTAEANGYRGFRAIKIYSLMSGTMRHITTFSWSTASTQMFTNGWSSGSVQGLYCGDYTSNNSNVCTRTYKYSGINQYNYQGYIAAVEFFSNTAATTRINTVLANNYVF